VIAGACRVIEVLIDETGCGRDAADANGRLAHALQRQCEGLHMRDFPRHQELQGIFSARVIAEIDESLIDDLGKRFRGDIAAKINIKFTSDLQVIGGPGIALRIKEVHAAAACDRNRCPWNEGEEWIFVKSPAIQSGEPGAAPAIVTESSPAETQEGLDELLIEELRDILHGEKQLTKALPKMAEAARFDQLRELFEQHLAETETQIERVSECFDLLGKTARGKPCRGMMGLVEEGQAVMEEGEKKEDAAADLALIGAAQRVEPESRAAAQAESDRSAAVQVPCGGRSTSQPSRSVAHVGRQDAGSD
jgi:hypothetical protein